MVGIKGAKWGAPGDLIQHVYWPGVPRVAEFTYTCSHGITPGTWQIVTFPSEVEPDVTPGAVGVLYVSDGFRSVALRNCKVDRVDGRLGEDGTTYTITGFDRRWLWRNQWGGLGGIRGHYNQLDRRGKLVPWSIRSPDELARLCLREMGERNFLVQLPPGLPRAAGANLDRFLRLGEFFPQTNSNPEANWDRTPPAEALAWLAELFGCRIVYQPVTDRVLVVPLGFGRGVLPDYPYEVITPNVDDPETPQAVASRGAPVRIQARFPLEPVAEEWDGSYVPIDQVSYAPKVGADKPQKTTISFSGPNPADVPGPTIEVTITWGDPPKTVTVRSTDPALSATGEVTDILAQFAANPDAKAAGIVAFAGIGGVFTLVGPPGLVFTVAVDNPGSAGDLWEASLDQAAVTGGRGWKGTNVPLFDDVIATERLAYFEAMAKARASVFRVFRLLRKGNVPCAADTRKPPLVLPWFGVVGRVQQITLHPSKVAQVVPQARIAGGQNAGNPVAIPGTVAGQGIMPEFYNGKSRDQEATVTGSVYHALGGRVLWSGVDELNQNTKPTDRVFVDFELTTDQFGNQLVVFSEHVYAYDSAGEKSFVRYPEFTLETGCVVTDYEADQFVRWEKVLPIPGGIAPIEWHSHPDLQVGVIGKYVTFAADVPANAGSQNPAPGGDAGARVPAPAGLLHKLVGWDWAPGDLAHANPAADAYNLNHAKKYELVFGDTRQYVGIWGIDPDGQVHQVTWSLSDRGPTTVASLNTEHSAWVPSFPERRRPELLPPNKIAAQANLAEHAEYLRLAALPSGPAVR